MPRRDDRKPSRDEKSESGPALKSWWQWLLVYPTLLIALAGHIPAVVDQVGSWTRGGAPEKAIWDRNVPCVLDPNPKLTAMNVLHFGITVQPCVKTGDFWLRVTDLDNLNPDTNTKIEWLTREEILKKTGFISKFSISISGLMPSSALAATLPAPGAARDRGALEPDAGAVWRAQAAPAFPVGLLCQFEPDRTTLVRRYKLSTGACTEDVISLVTGQLMRHGPAPCECR